MKVTKNIEVAAEWYMYFKENLWQGARERWNDMSTERKWRLCRYMQDNFEDDWTLSEIQINDFVWFEWDDIEKELENEK